MESSDGEKKAALQRGAASIIFTRDSIPGARYAILTGDKELLGKIILLPTVEIHNEATTSYGVVDALERMPCADFVLLIAHGALLSSIGKFTEAKIAWTRRFAAGRTQFRASRRR